MKYIISVFSVDGATKIYTEQNSAKDAINWLNHYDHEGSNVEIRVVINYDYGEVLRKLGELEK